MLDNTEATTRLRVCPSRAGICPLCRNRERIIRKAVRTCRPCPTPLMIRKGDKSFPPNRIPLEDRILLTTPAWATGLLGRSRSAFHARVSKPNF